MLKAPHFAETLKVFNTLARPQSERMSSLCMLLCRKHTLQITQVEDNRS